MSKTIRRNKFNKKNRFFQHYWECFSEKEVKTKKYIEPWKYHSDNYYTKSCKNSKQFLKKNEYKSLRHIFKKELSNLHNVDDFFLKRVKAKSIKWDLH